MQSVCCPPLQIYCPPLFLRLCANSAGLVQTPQYAPSDESQHFLLTGMSMENTVKMKRELQIREGI